MLRTQHTTHVIKEIMAIDWQQGMRLNGGIEIMIIKHEVHNRMFNCTCWHANKNLKQRKGMIR